MKRNNSERRSGNELVIGIGRRAFKSFGINILTLIWRRNFERDCVKSSINICRARKKQRKIKSFFLSSSSMISTEEAEHRLTNYLRQWETCGTMMMFKHRNLFWWWFFFVRESRVNGWDNQWRLSHKSALKSKNVLENAKVSSNDFKVCARFHEVCTS